MNTLDELRIAINTVDAELLTLLRRRAQLSLDVGGYKHAHNLPTLDPAREKEILDRLVGETSPPLTPEVVEAVFTVIFSASRALQETRTVAFLGPEGSYSHQAACNMFPCDATLIPQRSVDAVIQEVMAGRIDLGVVPVENSTEGMVSQTLDMMAEARLHVLRELMLPIRHHLLSRDPLEKITTVFSHPQALAQCRLWLREHLPQARTVETASTSDAALAATRHPGGAAIASRHAAEIYELPIVAANINDYLENITRFWLVSRTPAEPPQQAKTSIIITLDNNPGALFHAVGVFAEAGINLTKIESRPSRKGPWEYIFFIDFIGSLEAPHVKTAMDALRPYTRDITILGSYPKGDSPS